MNSKKSSKPQAAQKRDSKQVFYTRPKDDSDKALREMARVIVQQIRNSSKQ